MPICHGVCANLLWDMGHLPCDICYVTCDICHKHRVLSKLSHDVQNKYHCFIYQRCLKSRKSTKALGIEK